MNTLRKDIRNNGMALLVLLVIWLITHLVFRHFCPMVIITGYPCPGCGLTRAFIFLLRFDIHSAIEYNPSVFLWLVLILAAVYLRYVKERSLSLLKIPLVIVCTLTVAIYIWRMIYVFPGNPPMVYEPRNWLAFMKGKQLFTN